MYATTLSIINSLLLRDSPPFRAGVGPEMLSPGGYVFIIQRVYLLSRIGAKVFQSYTLASLRDGASAPRGAETAWHRALMRPTQPMTA